MGVWAGAANGGARPVQYRSGIWRWMRSIPEIKSFSFWMCNDHEPLKACAVVLNFLCAETLTDFAMTLPGDYLDLVCLASYVLGEVFVWNKNDPIYA